MEPIQVLILHRSRLTREAMAIALEKFGPFRTTGAAQCSAPHTHQELTNLIRTTSPDVIMLDLDFPFRTGISNARCILDHNPYARIILTGVPLVEPEIIACIETGVAGCELEDATLVELAGIIKGVHAGENRCSPQITKLLFLAVSGRSQPGQQGLMRGDIHLTRRELEVVELIERGLCNKKIAVDLCIEVQTVKNHVHNILDKLHLRKRHDAARYARNLGLLKGFNEIPEMRSESTST